MDAAKMVMGPHPGLAIVKFWQGVVEIVLRIILIVLSIGSLVASAIALEHILNGLPSSLFPIALENEVEDVTGLSYPSMIFNSLSGAAVGVAVSGVVLIYELIPIILRFVNIGLINYKIKIFLGIDIVVSFILASIFGIAGILSAFMAAQWAKLDDSPQLLTAIGVDAVPKARDVLAATAGMTLACALFMSILMTWLVFYLIQKWNKKLIKETVKSAVF